MTAGQLGVIAACVIGGIAVLWIGFALLLFPLRLVWRRRRLLGQRLGSLSLVIIVVWTVALAPVPFLYLWGWFVRFGQAVLIDVPRVVLAAAGQLASSCAEFGPRCSDGAVQLLGQVWGAGITQPVERLQVPPDLGHAFAYFAVGVTGVAAARKLGADSRLAPWRNGTSATVTALTVSFLVALYLSVTAILAVPIVGQKVPDIAPIRQALDTALQAMMPTELPRIGDIKQLANDSADLPNDLAPTVPAGAAPAPANSWVVTLWRTSVAGWRQDLRKLDQSAANYPLAAKDFADQASRYFLVADEGRVDTSLTQRHADLLQANFRLWQQSYQSAVAQCVTDLGNGLATLRQEQGLLQGIAANASSPPPDQILKLFPGFSRGVCGDVTLDPNDYLSRRSGPDEALGPFGFATAWLLRTESQELVLIVGLLGFGFFGALATGFIREFKGTEGNQLPSIGFIVPALIRGLGAAILVFLLAKGGLAIFTDNGDVKPNAYAIFFACFVAAVFSDDVWVWARNKQRGQFGAGKPPDGAAAP